MQLKKNKQPLDKNYHTSTLVCKKHGKRLRFLNTSEVTHMTAWMPEHYMAFPASYAV